ncbi:MAG: hypothetical protein WAM69_05010, partial [Candidatus Sulfotelmatobacter sp.]
RMLPDECVPRKLRSRLTGHECRTVPEEGLAGKRNGELLSLAEKAGFDVFLSLDRGIEFQQNLQSRRVAVLVVRAASSRLADLLPHVPKILKMLQSLRPGQVVSVG